MAAVSYVEPQNAGPEVKEIYEQKLKGRPGNFQKAMAHRPAMLKAFLDFYASVGRSLDRRLYELVYIRVATINGCAYCKQGHVKGGLRAGLTEQDLAALANPSESHFSEKERAALAFAEKLTRTPTSEMSLADVDALRPHFTEEQIVDLDVLIGLANLTNRFSDGMKIDVES
jgi:uncharacterized peroxidase-related enzyme